MSVSHPDYYYNNNDRVNVKTLIEVIYNIGVYGGLTDDQCQNTDTQCYSDHIELEKTNGVIIIDNSNINGGQIAIYDQNGYVELYDTEISHALIGIYADNSISFKVEFCNFNRIGMFHIADYISLHRIYDMFVVFQL